MPLSFYRGIFIIAPSSLDLGSSFNSFKTVTGRQCLDGNMFHLDGNMFRPDGASKHDQKVFLTHVRLQSRPDEIANELFCLLLFIARFNLVNIRISWTSWNLTLYIFELSFQHYKACSNPKPRTLDMTVLVNVVRTKFRRHYKRGSWEFLFIKLVQKGLQMR